MNAVQRKQAGMTLTESLLVLAVGALIAVLAYGAYRMATSDVKVQSQVQGTVQLVGKIKQIYSSAANYGTASASLNQAVNDAKIVPSDFKGSGATITNAWGGAVNVAVGATNTQFTVTFVGVPQEGCIEFVTGIASAATTLVVGTGASKDVKTATAAFDPALAAAACGVTTPGNIVLTAQ